MSISMGDRAIATLNFYSFTMPGKCRSYNPKWLDDEKYLQHNFKSWVEETADPQTVRCEICRSDLNVSSMGVSALVNHAAKISHKKALSSSKQPSMGISRFFTGPSAASKPSVPNKEVSVTATVDSKCKRCKDCACTKRTGTLESYMKEEALKGEILWVFHLVMGHHSFNSHKDSISLMQKMFSDSDIAQQMLAKETKLRYLSTYGLGPYLQRQLKDKIAQSGDIVLAFDKSLNKEMQMKQMDLHVRFWNAEEDVVESRFINSVFLGHATADIITDCLLKELITFNNLSTMQISMDGPNVNLKVLKDLTVRLEAETGRKILDPGSCSLHTAHNAFRAGHDAAGWRVETFLSSLYYLFKDSPARREDFIRQTGTETFPLKFCQHRWVENLRVAQRALSIWPQVKIYLESLLPKDLNLQSYRTLAECKKDPLTVMHIQIFMSIAECLERFLVKFQTDAPSMPFLAKDLMTLIRNLLSRFIKQDVIDQSSDEQLFELDLLDKEKRKETLCINIGCLAEESIKKLSLSDKQKYVVKSETRQFLMKIVQALKLKSPLQKSAVRSMSCLIPEEIDQSGSVGKFKVLTQRLVDAGWLSHTDADEAREEYAGLRRSIMEDPQKASLFKGHLQQRLDEFYAFNIGNKRMKLWEVLKKVLTLSHGQAFVERGFSTNKETMDINMKGKSLVAQRIICQHVEKVGGILQVEVTQGMMVAASNARASYHLYLEEKKKLVEAEGKRKRKAEKEAEVEGLRQKKRRLEEDVSELEKEADWILARSLDAKNTKALVLQCLAMKDMAKKKGNEITEVSSKIEELMK